MLRAPIGTKPTSSRRNQIVPAVLAWESVFPQAAAVCLQQRRVIPQEEALFLLTHAPEPLLRTTERLTGVFPGPAEQSLVEAD